MRRWERYVDRMVGSSEGPWVKYDEAVAAVAAAQQRVDEVRRQQQIVSNALVYKIGYREGQRDERERCRAAVLDHFKVAPLAAEPILRRIG